MDKDAIAQAVRQIIEAIGEDPNREGLVNTPDRIADMYEELFSGLTEDPRALIESGFDAEDYHEMVVVKDIPFTSMCVPSKQHVDAVGGSKCAMDVKLGDWLYTLDGGEIQTTKVVALSNRSAREVIRLTPEGSTPIHVTPDHPVMTPDGWQPAAELKRGDTIEWMNARYRAQRRYPIREGYSLGYALGAIAADASIQDGRRICFSVRSREFAERFRTAWGTAFGWVPRIESVQVPSGFLKRNVQMFRVRIVSSYIARFMLKWFGCQGPTKETKRFHLPGAVLRSHDMTKGFLDGYCDGDGYRLRQTGRMIISSNVQFLQELGAVVGARPAMQRAGVARLYISDRWGRPGWYGRRGFVPSQEEYDVRDSQLVRLEEVLKLRATWRKPYTVYSFTCAPYPTFCISGVLTHNCEHHFLPFYGRAHIGYLPQGRIVGISKIARLLDVLARRPQVQERLTWQIVDALCEGGLGARGAAAIIEATHLCMTLRGVKKPGSKVVTIATRGTFRDDPRARAEFFALIEGRK
jgi:GTP cyclohydrolase I